MMTWQQRVREAALRWVGTPYHDHGQVWGPTGGVDCVTLLIEVFSEAGVIDHFTPPWYAPEAGMLPGEQYLNAILQYGHAVEPPWEVGDVLMFRMLKAPSCGHAAIYIGEDEIVHADYHSRRTVRDTLNRTLFRHTLAGGYRLGTTR
jgi:cell wall-associated NlpC family hydrolase